MQWILIIVGVLLAGFAIYMLMFPGHKSPASKTEAIKVKGHPNQTRYEARKETKASLARGEALAAQANEFVLTNEPTRLEMEGRVGEAEAENKILVSTKASQHEMDTATYGQKKLSEIELETARQLSGIKIGEHEELKKIDLDARWKEILQDSNAADLALIGDHLVTKKLRQELREARTERHQIRTGEYPEELRQELLGDYDKFVTRLEAAIDARETGHLLSANKETPKGLTSGEAESRAEYPAETDEDSQ